jgi:hypothetical protein
VISAKLHDSLHQSGSDIAMLLVRARLCVFEQLDSSGVARNMRARRGGMARPGSLLCASGGGAALMPARQGSRHRDGQPSNGGDAVFVIRDDGLCSLTKNSP